MIPLLCLALLSADWRLHDLPFTLATGEGPRKFMPGTMPGGLAAFDFDGDGLTDLFFPNGAELPSLVKSSPAFHHRLLRNLGGGRFTDATAPSGILQQGYACGAASADFDRDGRPDLLVLGVGFLHLYRNEGGGRFTLTTLPNQGRWAYAAHFADFDRDGDLDLFIVNYVRWSAAADRECRVGGQPDYCHPRFYPPSPNQLFENRAGAFFDVSQSSGIAAFPGKGMGLAVADFDANGLPDVFVTNDRELNFLFLNQGKLKFTENAFDWGVAVPADGKSPSAMGAAAFDFNRDGKPDLVYTALREETFPLYRNTGKDFADAGIPTRFAALTRSMSGWGIASADFDRDGWPDLVAARSDALSVSGAKGPQAREPLALFLNHQGKHFSLAPGFSSPARMWRWLAIADLNGDSCPDIVATALNEPAVWLENPCR